MSAPTNTGGPAFPHANPGYDGNWDDRRQIEGMTLREYAAIHLRMPNSGVDWLDDMIREARRDELAAKAMQGFLAHPENGNEDVGQITEWSYMQANAMLAAREAP